MGTGAVNVGLHGAWLTSGSWGNFIEYFDSRGFDVSAPEWPRKHENVAEQREAADEIKGLGRTEIRGADEPA